METEKFDLTDEWILNWDDLTDFEIIPVKDSPTKAAQKCDATEEG
jgi:hypothetical protein